MASKSGLVILLVVGGAAAAAAAHHYFWSEDDVYGGTEELAGLKGSAFLDPNRPSDPVDGSIPAMQEPEGKGRSISAHPDVASTQAADSTIQAIPAGLDPPDSSAADATLNESNAAGAGGATVENPIQGAGGSLIEITTQSAPTGDDPIRAAPQPTPPDATNTANAIPAANPATNNAAPTDLSTASAAGNGPGTASAPAAGPNATIPPGHSGHVQTGTRKSGAEVPADHILVGFDQLATFWYEPPDPDKGAKKSNADQIPETVKAYDGKKVVLEGFMIPISVVDGKVTSFILSRYFSSCCFGQMPEMNEWVEVEIDGNSGIDYLPYGSVECQGTFAVGEVLDDYGYVRSLFRMKAAVVKESL